MSRPLRILVAEDEAVIARRVARLTAEILGPLPHEITVVAGVAEARERISTSPPDLLLLDLNLEGDDGFAVLRDLAPQPFDTIVISAHRERALEAFDLGVRDFVAKPFSRARLEMAIHRFLSPATRAERPVAHLGVRRNGSLEFIPLQRVAYIRGAGTRSEIVLADGRVVLHERMLDRLEGMLPLHFERIHRSLLVDVRRIRRLIAQEGSRYAVEMDDGTMLPVGRTRVASLRARLA